MTRRELFSLAAAVPASARQPLILPLRFVMDGEAKWRPGQLEYFWSRIWPEAVRDLRWCGIQPQTSLTVGSIWRPSGREPAVSGLQHGVVNLVITNRIPMEWDRGRTLSGATARYRGYHLCMIALDHAHGHQAPLLSVNTCTHELLHALLLDIFENKPEGLAGEAREFRIDWYATRLWLFHDGGAIRGAARKYVERLANTTGGP